MSNKITSNNLTQLKEIHEKVPVLQMKIKFISK